MVLLSRRFKMSLFLNTSSCYGARPPGSATRLPLPCSRETVTSRGPATSLAAWVLGPARRCECSPAARTAYGTCANDLRSRATRLRNSDIPGGGKGLEKPNSVTSLFRLRTALHALRNTYFESLYSVYFFWFWRCSQCPKFCLQPAALSARSCMLSQDCRDLCSCLLFGDQSATRLCCCRAFCGLFGGVSKLTTCASSCRRMICCLHTFCVAAAAYAFACCAAACCRPPRSGGLW